MEKARRELNTGPIFAPSTAPAKLHPEPNLRRRSLLQSVAGTALLGLIDPAIRSTAWAAGSDAPEKKEVKIGFIPLTDCASVVIASVMKFDEKYGIKIVPSKEASWAGVRDKLVNGEDRKSTRLNSSHG